MTIWKIINGLKENIHILLPTDLSIFMKIQRNLQNEPDTESFQYWAYLLCPLLTFLFSLEGGQCAESLSTALASSSLSSPPLIRRRRPDTMSSLSPVARAVSLLDLARDFSDFWDCRILCSCALENVCSFCNSLETKLPWVRLLMLNGSLSKPEVITGWLFSVGEEFSDLLFRSSSSSPRVPSFSDSAVLVLGRVVVVAVVEPNPVDL